MDPEKGDRKKDQNEKQDFDINKELSLLIQKNVLPEKIGFKLKNKLEQSNIQINKEQLYALVDKIKEAIKTYEKSNSETKEKVEKKPSQENQEDMNKITEYIDKLEERLDEIEQSLNEKIEKQKSNITTTDDIEIPGQKKEEKYISENEQWSGVQPLKNIPSDPENIIVLMKWIQYLMDRCGRHNLPNVLDYYVDIGWISEEAKINLLEYSNGITEEKPEQDDREIKELPSKDHIQSFLFIQKLKGNSFDKHFLDRIEDKITRMTKKIDYRYNR